LNEATNKRTATDVTFKHNLENDYQRYVDAKIKADLAEEYTTQIDDYLNEMENQLSLSCL